MVVTITGWGVHLAHNPSSIQRDPVVRRVLQEMQSEVCRRQFRKFRPFCGTGGYYCVESSQP